MSLPEDESPVRLSAGDVQPNSSTIVAGIAQDRRGTQDRRGSMYRPDRRGMGSLQNCMKQIVLLRIIRRRASRCDANSVDDMESMVAEAEL
jgi:hypothetical protein